MREIFILTGIFILFVLLTAWGVVDAALRDFGSTGKKALWIIVASIPFIGFLIYFAFGRRLGRKPLNP
jgi:uncharacterized membrane protein YhaH (DUF805 family)